MVPNGWELTCLGNIANTTMGYAFKSKDFVKNGIPLIRMGNLYQNKLDLARSPIFLPSEFSVEYERFLLKSGDLVMSMTGTMGKRDYGFTVQIPKGTPDSLLNQRVMKFDTKANSALEYIKYLLRSESFLTRLYAFPGGTKQANLSAKQVSEILVLLPPLPEQRKIAKILSTWDKAITTTEKLIETSKQQKKALMQQLLTGKKRLVNPETGKVFEGEWEDKDLNYFSKVIVSPVDKKIVEGEIPVELCNYTDVYYNTNITRKLTFMKATAKQSEIDKFTLEVDDVIITKDSETPGDIAVPALVSEDLNGVVCGYHLAIVRADKQQADGAFINYLFAMPQTRYYFFTLATGATRFGLSIGGINKAHFCLPPLQEQQKIASVLAAADKDIEVLEAKLSHLKQEKKALMQQLLTGKIRVQVEESVAA